MPRLALIGDAMLGRGVATEIGRRPAEWFWGSAHPVLASADAVLANLECAITETHQRWERTPKTFHFRAPPGAIAILRAGNVRCVSLANNHVLDYETEGLRDTIHHLDAAGIAYVGAGRTLETARAPAVVDVAGIKVGVIAATDNEPPFAAGPNRPGTNYLELGVDPGTAAELGAAAGAAERLGATLVVASLHWGPNMVVSPPAKFRRLARELASVTIVHGHSAHVFQGVERHGGRLALYDTGDFLDDYAVDPVFRNDWSFIFLVDLVEPGTIERLRMVPVKLNYARVDLATGRERDQISGLMRARAKALGTELVPTAEGLVLELGS